MKSTLTSSSLGIADPYNYISCIYHVLANVSFCFPLKIACLHISADQPPRLNPKK